MDPSSGLEALEEEDETFESSARNLPEPRRTAVSRHDDDESDEESGGVHKEEPNQFDSLCDGLLASLSLTHGSFAEMVALKDKLMKHSLPPNVLATIENTTTRAFRSLSDLHLPVTELVRVVRLYSTPWDEKSVALKKLHDDYEGKKTQLNIAVKRLQLVDAHTKRIAKEKRIMNWEKLYARLTSVSGHGRRWRFLVDSFKKKINEGPVALYSYINKLDIGDAGDEDEEPQEDVETQVRVTDDSRDDEVAEPDVVVSDHEGTEEDASSSPVQYRDSEPDVDSDLRSDKTEGEETTVISLQQPYIKPPSRDAAVWTHEPSYDLQLRVRVGLPQDIKGDCFRVRVTCQSQTNITSVMEAQKTKKNQNQDDVKEEADAIIQKYEEMSFVMGKNAPSKVRSTLTTTNNMKLAVHADSEEKLVAMATLEMEEFDTLDLPSVYLAPNCGDTDYEPQAWDTSLDLDSTTVTTETADVTTDVLNPDALHSLEELNLPLYSVDDSSVDPQPIGTLPVTFYWAKREHPTTVDRLTQSETLRELILDTLGVDIYETTRDDLHKVTADRASSAVRLTPDKSDQMTTTDHDLEEQGQGDDIESVGDDDATETVVDDDVTTMTGTASEQLPQMVLREDYEKLKNKHANEMALLQEEYEQRLQDLVESFQQIQLAQAQGSLVPEEVLKAFSPERLSMSPPARSADIIRSRGPQPPPAARSRDPRPARRRPSPSRPPPADDQHAAFIERLRRHNEESQRLHEELQRRVHRDVSEDIERKLAFQYKLGPEADGAPQPYADVSLPAVFMPTKVKNAHVYNPRARQYFHATGAGPHRLTQPPSMVNLPPLPKNRVAVVNLFDLSRNFSRGGTDWLLERYLTQLSQGQGQQVTPAQGQRITSASQRHQQRSPANKQQVGPNVSLSDMPENVPDPDAYVEQSTAEYVAQRSQEYKGHRELSPELA